ncbi:MAG: oxygen-dependent coproporphyrinogen oxidase [Saprospiraceae bacterium]
MEINKTEITEWFKTLQDQICASLEELDGVGKFQQDLWERDGGGGGRTRVIQGEVIEKGGVNFSAVHGPISEKMAATLKLEEGSFYATGVSIVLHPKSPMVPIIHMNVRYFEMSTGVWWFGGGIDLTPHYVVPADAQIFHQHLKNACDQHHPTYYPEFKKWADDYFFIKHRNETRGIGGIFFDHLTDKTGISKLERFEFVKSVGETFVPAYREMVQRNISKRYGEKEKNWQALRRGRYVEFNLVWDRGTKFGLDSNGRTESILMSLPPVANWVYNTPPEPDSEEEKTLSFLRKDIDWLAMTS